MDKIPTCCIALDLDGTVLDSQGQLSDVNKEAVAYAISEGAHMIIASGRSFRSLPECITKIPGIEYAITSNGAAIYQVPTGKKLHGYTLDGHTVHRILELTKEEPIVYEAFIEGHAYADEKYVKDPVKYGASPQAVAYVKRTRQFVKDMDAFIRMHIEKLDSIDIVVSNLQLKERICKKLSPLTEEIYLTSSVNQLIEISDKHAGKASGLRYIKDILDVPRERMAAFGNADNDVDMIRYAGYGYAVENASDSCREAADYIVETNDENGVSRGIYEFLKKMKEKE